MVRQIFLEDGIVTRRRCNVCRDFNVATPPYEPTLQPFLTTKRKLLIPGYRCNLRPIYVASSEANMTRPAGRPISGYFCSSSVLDTSGRDGNSSLRMRSSIAGKIFKYVLDLGQQFGLSIAGRAVDVSLSRILHTVTHGTTTKKTRRPKFGLMKSYKSFDNHF